METSLTGIIVDDEPNAIQQLKTECKAIGIGIPETTTNPLKALEIIKKHHPDLVFLDIEMPQKNGIDVLQDIAGSNPNCHVIMVTAYDRFMLEAFRNSAFDYLLKPVERNELRNVVERLTKYQTERMKKEKVESFILQLKNKIKIPSTYETHYFTPDQILYCQADGKYTMICQANGERLFSSSNLGGIEKLLPPGIFYRISRSFIINTTYLQKMNKQTKKCTLVSKDLKTEVPFSKKYIPEIENLF